MTLKRGQPPTIWTPDVLVTLTAEWEANAHADSIPAVILARHGIAVSSRQVSHQATRLGLLRPQALAVERRRLEMLNVPPARPAETVRFRGRFPVPAGGFSMMGGTLL